MAGLLDFLFAQQQGGLLPFPPQFDGDNNPIPGMGMPPQGIMPPQAMAQAPMAPQMGPQPGQGAPPPQGMPQPAPQMSAPAPAAAPAMGAPEGPNLLQRLAGNGGMLGGIAGTIGSLTGQTARGIDPTTSQGPAGQAYRLMVSKGVDPATARLMASQKETAVAWLQKNVGVDQYAPILQGNTIVGQKNLATGKVEADPRTPEGPIRIVNEMYANPTKYGFKGPDDPSLHEAARQKLSGQSTNVSVNTAANPVLEGVGKQIVESRASATAAARQTIPAIHEARKALDEGASTGAFADQRVALQKFGGLFGLDATQAANSETLRSALGDQVLGSIKQLGANPSNADRDYIERVKGGSIALEEKTIRRLLDMQEKYSRQAIKNFNTDAGNLMKVNHDAYRGIAPLMSIEEPGEYKAPERPAAATPAAPAVRPAAPAVGTIQDGHQFLGGDPSKPASWRKVQ